MDLRLLRAYVTVAEDLHFGRAAARLSITPPSLSQQIKSLERSLGVRLFERDSKQVRLTAAGEALLGPAYATLASADAFVDQARQLRRTRPVLRLGFLLFSLTEVPRELLAAYGRENPDVDVRFRQFEWDDPSAGLRSGAVELALVRPPFTGSDRLEWVELARDPLLALVAAGHPIATAGSPVTVDELVAQPFLEVALVTDPVFAAEWYLHDHRTPTSPPPGLSEATTSEEWLAEVAMGRGVDVVPEPVARDYARPGLAFVPITGLAPSSLVLAWDPGRLTDEAARFVRFAGRHPAVRRPPS